MLFRYALLYVVSFIGIFLGVLFLISLIEGRHRIRNPKPTRFPFVSVIIPAYNEQENIRKTIESARKLDYPNFEILVVDDGSTDNTFKIASQIATKDPRIKAFSKKNGGKASALNFAIKRSKGEVIATLDADSFVMSDALMKMIGYLEDPRVASVTPSMKVYRPKNVLQKIQQVEYVFGILYRKIFAFMNMIHVTPGPFSLYKKSFFERHGGFDEKTTTEDMEIAMRMQTHHYRIENSVDAVVYTVSPDTLKELTKQRTRWYYGLIKNLEVYTHLFDWKRYGYFAILSLPAALISVVSLLVLTGYFVYTTTQNFIGAFNDLSSVGFDFITLMRGFKLEYLYYGYIGPMTSFLLISLAISLLFLYIAKVLSGDKNNLRTGYIYYLWYYSYLFAFWWVVAIFSRMFGAVKWKEKEFN